MEFLNHQQHELLCVLYIELMPTWWFGFLRYPLWKGFLLRVLSHIWSARCIHVKETYDLLGSMFSNWGVNHVSFLGFKVGWVFSSKRCAKNGVGVPGKRVRPNLNIRSIPPPRREESSILGWHFWANFWGSRAKPSFASPSTTVP